MLTIQAADERVKRMTDSELEQLSYQVTGRHDDQNTLATRAVLEKARRAEQAQHAAAVAAPAIAAKERARYAYEQSGLPASGFDRWYADRLGRETSEKLDQERAAMWHVAQRSF
jgi:hypothetical protein